MTRMFLRAFCVVAAAAALAEAHAGAVTAQVYQASSGFHLDSSSSAPGTDAQATAAIPAGGFGTGQSRATRLGLAVQTHGLGTANVGATGLGGRGVSAWASAATNYALIDTGTGQQLSDAQSAGITLAFTFHATGSFSVDPLWLSSGGVSFGATVYSFSYDQTYAGLSTVFGPVPPPAGSLFYDDYVDSGDATLRGSIDRRLTVLHTSYPTGSFEFSARADSANGANTWLNWSLESVSLVGSARALGAAGSDAAAVDLLAGPLALRIEGSDALIAVSAVSTVPEPASAALLLGGIAAGAAFARRRRTAR